MSDIIITVGLTAAISAVGSFLITLIKKGEFESWGVISGKFLSRLVRMKIGKGKWEKIEDSIALAIISFASGFKKGLDSDDDKSDEELKKELENGKKNSDQS